MKQILSILFLSVLIISCQKEKNTVEDTPQLPDTVNLVESTITGKIIDNTGEPVSQSEVSVHYKEYELSKTTSSIDGVFSLPQSPIHASESYILISKEGHAPNYYASNIINESSFEILPVMKPLLVDESFDNGSKVIVSGDLEVNLPDGLFASTGDINLEAQWLDFAVDAKETMLATRTENSVLSFSHALYISGVDNEDESLDWEIGKNATMTLQDGSGLGLEDQVWFFNLEKALWEPKGLLSLNAGQYTYDIDQSGYYAFTSSCSNDVDAPTPYCINLTVANFADLNNAVIWAEDFNIASFDNCTADADLVFEIRRTTDICNNGGDTFAESLALCPADEDTVLDIIMKVTDEASNADSCITTIEIQGDTIPNSGCMNDTTPPTPYCINLSTVVLPSTNTTEIWAVDFNVGSFDNCTAEDDLTYKLKKTTDICNNGSDTLAEKITICQAEVGMSLVLEIFVFDENNNSDYCQVSLSVVQ